MRQSWSVNNLTDFAVRSIQRAQADDSPFYHLRFDRVFPDDFYAAMLEAMPVGDGGYRALSGKAKVRNVTPEGKPTRTKIDLFPEYIRHLPPKKCDAADRQDFSRGITEWQEAEKRADAILAKFRLRVCRCR